MYSKLSGSMTVRIFESLLNIPELVSDEYAPISPYPIDVTPSGTLTTSLLPVYLVKIPFFMVKSVSSANETENVITKQTNNKIIFFIALPPNI